MLLEGLIKDPVEVPPLEEEERPLPMPPPPEEPEKKGFWDKVLDVVQFGLDVVGCVPVVGAVANVVNAGISVGRGDWAGAGLSIVSCIPGAGPFLKGGKWAKGIANATSKFAKGVTASKAMNVVQKARNIAQHAFQFVLDKIKSVKGKVFSGSRSGTSSQDLLEVLGKLNDRMQAILGGQGSLGRKLATDFAVGSTRLMVEDYLCENYGIDLPFFPLNRKAFSTKLGSTSRGGTSRGGGTPKNQEQGSKQDHKGNTIGNGKQYSTLYEASTGKGTSRSAHRNSANKEFYNQMANDTKFKNAIDDFFGYDVMGHMKSGKGGLKNPSKDWAWHHPADKPGVVRLVPKDQHQSPLLQDILHPGPNGQGGFGLFK